MIDDLHTILMILQVHISFVKMANHLCRNWKASRLGVEHLVPDGQPQNKWQERYEDTRESPTRGCAWLQWQHGPVHHHLTMEPVVHVACPNFPILTPQPPLPPWVLMSEAGGKTWLAYCGHYTSIH